MNQPEIKTIIISALFGGLISSLITQYFFDHRDKRKIYLEKYEGTLRTITSHQKRIAQYVTQIHPILENINHQHSNHSDPFLLPIMREAQQFNDYFDKDQFYYIDEMVFIHLIKYYDNDLKDLADEYYEKSRAFLTELTSILKNIRNRTVPSIDNYKKTLDEQSEVSNRLLNELRSNITNRMKAPWDDILNYIKKTI